MGTSQSTEKKSNAPVYTKKDYKKYLPGVNVYKKHNNNVYWKGDIVESACGQNFIDMSYGYGKDNKSVYYNGKKIEVHKVRNFEIIKKNYATDDIHIFYKDKKLRKTKQV